MGYTSSLWGATSQCCTLLRTLGLGRWTTCSIWKFEQRIFLSFETFASLGNPQPEFRTVLANGLNFDYRMIDVKLFSGLECRERYPTIFRHGPILGTFRGPRGTWNLETIRVWYLIWSIFWDKWPKFSVWHSFWGPYFSSQSQSGMKPSCLDYLNFYRLGPEFRQNSEHFLTKMPRNWTLDSGTCSGLCGWQLPNLLWGNVHAVFQIIWKWLYGATQHQ